MKTAPHDDDEYGPLSILFLVAHALSCASCRHDMLRCSMTEQIEDVAESDHKVRLADLED